MVFRLFRRDPRLITIDALYGRIAEASRQPALYVAHGVSDTAQGRFESLVLHVMLVLRRLRSLPAPAPDVAQDLVDTTFQQLDHALREMGIGDVSVPKRMKKLAKSFYGRAESYDAALDAADSAALAAALARNVMDREAPAVSLARYVQAADAGLASLTLDAILEGASLFPDAAAFEEPVP